MAWEVEFTDELETWWNDLDEDDQEAIQANVELLMEQGPGLRRPVVGQIVMSRHAHMKELVCPRDIRVLFAFDPRRTAILLIGGNKSKRWKEWYEEMVPVADDLYDGYLEELREEGEI